MTTFVPNPTGLPNQGAAPQFLMNGGAPGAPGSAIAKPPLQYDPFTPTPPMAGAPPGPAGPGMHPFLRHHGHANTAPRPTQNSGPFSGPGYYHINGMPMLLPGNNLATGGANNWLGNGANLQSTQAPGPVTNQQIQQWFAQNPSASDGQIAQAMGQYGVTPDRLAAATGADPASVMQRYAAVGQGILGS